ncbi:MAG: threonine aldolase [Flavobacteriales bacterium]|nr:threonine aldolase [Flavobacteriales bacterium]
MNINSSENLISPGLIIIPERIIRNIKKMISIAGSPKRLWPHVKTHKLREIIDFQKEYGISKFKCATICEAEMLALSEVEKILLAIQPTKLNLIHFIKLKILYPKIEFSTIVDNLDSLKLMSDLSSKNNIKLSIWIDINNGMNRTGVNNLSTSLKLIKNIDTDKNLILEGLHVYDGHIRNPDFKKRKKECDKAYQFINEIINSSIKNGIKIQNFITGGSPTFNIHSTRKGNYLSPGTTLLWDEGYKKLFPEMNFEIAAILVSRIISKPNKNILCLDLGHKSVASEMPLPRVIIRGLENAKHISQSEEHLIIESKKAKNYNIGDLVYATPFHICPTVSKFEYLQTISNGKISSLWKVKARNYNLKNNVFNF